MVVYLKKGLIQAEICGFGKGLSFVPEPTALTLVGLSSLLIFARKRCRNLLPAAGLFATTLVHAQTYYLQSLGGVGSVPYPINPYGDSGSRSGVSTGIYLIEDGSGDRS